MYNGLQRPWAKKAAILYDCQMKKTEMQAGRTGTLTQRQMNTKRKTNKERKTGIKMLRVRATQRGEKE